MRRFAMVFNAEKEQYSIIYRDQNDPTDKWYVYIENIEPDAVEHTVQALNRLSNSQES